jgi:Xaa-Pro aminopeptidase/Xaa-Pro dipeptidase
MGVYADRRKRVLSMAKGREVIAARGANMFWLTDFWGAGAALVREDRTVVVTSVLEENRARELGNEVEVVAVKKWADVAETVHKLLDKKVKVYADDDFELRRFKRVEMKPSLFLEARRVKDEVELERIAKASKGLDGIFEALMKEIRPGRTEWEVAAEVMKHATLSGLTPSGSDSALSPTIVASGENGALPHSELTDRKIREGDFVVADIFFRYRGYNSDETRTYAVGRVSGDMRRNYHAVLEAQEGALELIKEGTPCKDVNDRAVGILRKHGVDKYLNHGIGHGVGIDIHELPRISTTSADSLVSNDVVTDEPGVYFLGKYGIRIEDTVKTGRKPVALTRSTKELVTVG